MLLVSVRRVLESYESVVIQGWWPDSRRVTDVDEQEPRTLRPQQVAISTRSPADYPICYSNSDQILRRSEMTLCAISDIDAWSEMKEAAN